jgi:protein TonB
MDRPSRISAPLSPGKRKDRWARRAASGVRRPWRIAVLVSVAFHLLLVALAVHHVRSKPADPDANPLGTVELLMVEKKGSGQPTPPQQPKSQTAPSPPVPAAPPPPSQTATASPVAPTVSDPAGEPVPPQAPAAEPSKATEDQAPKPAPPERQLATAAEVATPRPAPPPKQEVPVFHLDGTDSDTNAIAMGDQVIAASPDDRFRNRPPIYPYDAAARGQHGEVVVVIHVSEYGVSTGADVAVSSGVVSLDRAALDAVRKWHFRPAMKDGRTVPFDMPMRFIFEAE